MTTQETPPQAELIELSIDDQVVRVPKGTNIIKAASELGIEVPYYCYHPHLSVPANCRICQVEVEGAPKLMVGCHTQVAPNMKVRTHRTSEKVRATQAATMELLLINHPLDCTVCDQAGQCKLQDYHYEYNARHSRFVEEKVHKPKAVELGPTIMLDAERCIACTRCVRFCDEVTETSELGLVHRGDRVEITVREGKPLNNPFSGTVADLCPVGALTHKKWRFRSRIWFTKQTDSICPGCSTGCNVKVASRDGEVVQVKARLNSAVNKEWLCDEGRYGFMRFLPKERLLAPRVQDQPILWEEALKKIGEMKRKKMLVFLAPDMLLEEYALVKEFMSKHAEKSSHVVLAHRSRELSALESMLIAPDYAANIQGAIFSGVLGDAKTPGEVQAQYVQALQHVKAGEWENIFCIGDRALAQQDLKDLQVLQGLSAANISAALLCDETNPLSSACQIVLPTRSILEKRGLLVNKDGRLQYTEQVVDFPDNTEPAWRILEHISAVMGASLTRAQSDRELTLDYLAKEARLAGVRIKDVKKGGCDVQQLSSVQAAA